MTIGSTERVKAHCQHLQCYCHSIGKISTKRKAASIVNWCKAEESYHVVDEMHVVELQLLPHFCLK